MVSVAHTEVKYPKGRRDGVSARGRLQRYYTTGSEVRRREPVYETVFVTLGSRRAAAASPRFNPRLTWGGNSRESVIQRDAQPQRLKTRWWAGPRVSDCQRDHHDSV